MSLFKFNGYQPVSDEVSAPNIADVVDKNSKNIINELSDNHIYKLIWEKRLFVINFIMYLVLLVSMATIIVTTHIAAENINAKFDTLIALTEQQQEKYDTMIKSLSSIETQILTMNEDKPADTQQPQSSAKEEEQKVTYNTKQFSQKSGFTAEQFNKIIDTTFADMKKSNSKLKDIGKGLYEAEQKYNVNGLYLLGIASLESGWGTSKYATERNNLYGLINMRFNNANECTVYMGKLMRTNYIDRGYDTLQKVQPKYCPSCGTNWVSDVTWCTNKYIKTANKLYINT